MRSSVRHGNAAAEWTVFILSVGLSLTLLFFSQNSGVKSMRGDVGDLLSVTVRPVSALNRLLALWSEHERLQQLSMDLSVENETLRDALLENVRLRAMLEFRDRSPLELKPASVIARVGPVSGGILRIDEGRLSGLLLNSAVLTPHGLVGKIIELSDESALVQTLVGNSYGVSVMIERNRLVSILRWDGPDTWLMEGLSDGADVKLGDLILTSGSGSVFPKGIRVGIVANSTPVVTQFGQSWKVKPFVDFRTVETVFVATGTRLAGDPLENYSNEGERP